MSEAENKKVGIVAYIMLVFAVVFFSGLCKSNEWWGVFDFTTLDGNFGSLISKVALDGETADALTTGKSTFRGIGGSGAKDGFLFALYLVPSVMFALAVLNVVEHYGALDAARKLLTPLLRPLLGIPGESGLALIASFQSTDAGASMTRELYNEGKLTQKEVSVFSMYQFTAGAAITNFLGSGAVLFTLTNADNLPLVPTSIGLTLGVILVMKIVGANIFRLYLFLTKQD